MALKDIWAKTDNWLRSHKIRKIVDYRPKIDEEGLINKEEDLAEEGPQEGAENSRVLVKPVDKAQSLEKLQAGFDKLIEQLRGINEHLNHQVNQTEDLMGRIDSLPKLLESYPAVVEGQKQLTQELVEQLKVSAAKEEQFIDAVEKIPTEVGKQTDALVGIDHQLAASADTDVQMVENFNKFNETLDKINESTIGHKDSIMQMSRTFAASDRYLKYVMSRQRKSFMWIFMVAVGVCVAAILILTGIIIYLKQ